MKQKHKTMVKDTKALEDTRGQVLKTIEGNLIQKEAGHAHQGAEVDHQNISLIVVISTEIIHQVAAILAIVITDENSTKTVKVTKTGRATINRVAADTTKIIDVGECKLID